MLVILIAIFVLPINAFTNIFNRDNTTSMTPPLGSGSVMGNETEYWAVVIVAFNETPPIYPYIYDALISSTTWDPAHIKLLYRENATRDAIIDSLDWLRTNADSNDYIFFADNSHGTVEGGYLTGQYGIVPWDYNTTGIISITELDSKFDEIQAKGMCLIFDCCLAGNFIDSSRMGPTGITPFKSFNLNVAVLIFRSIINISWRISYNFRAIYEPMNPQPPVIKICILIPHITLRIH